MKTFNSDNVEDGEVERFFEVVQDFQGLTSLNLNSRALKFVTSNGGVNSSRGSVYSTISSPLTIKTDQDERRTPPFQGVDADDDSYDSEELTIEMRLKTVEMLALMRGLNPQDLFGSKEFNSILDEKDSRQDEVQSDDYITDLPDESEFDSDYLIGDTFVPVESPFHNSMEDDLNCKVDEEYIFDMEL